MNEQIFNNTYLKKDEINKDSVTIPRRFYRVMADNYHFGIVNEEDMWFIHYKTVIKHRDYLKTFNISNYHQRNGEIVYSGFTIFTEELKVVFNVELVF